ncbi:N-formylglutamate amidohydrolase [Defluviimonas sp. 20V17]|uniref:N-formylglutamate amidohydrolase n=1 Tax=Allgaiera indica TaxID=765699 RepID=A0AAN4UR78_9RHOB|nr:N-formylglutamate amidohydrolase [Allgaiera indica]KDB02577.1 N-formylglutamate amidohydrolase [Defluviimonas sp. 20V17]GHE01615.1 N-formylglutamate amidohydrolase [Allgaiera indica]SDW97983.1 N-formylglutamate deformylase [Allgaiera indica]
MTRASAAYDLYLPARRASGVVFSSPHSGQEYGAAFLAASVLDPHAIRSSEDAFVDRLFSDAPKLGAPLICARAPRAFVDLNRAVDELDPGVIAGIRTAGHNPRVTSGLGVIPRVVSNGRAIYRGKISAEEAHLRLHGYWKPYHDRLRALIDEGLAQFGQSLLIDCHSMPHEAIQHHGRVGRPHPEIVLGDRFGASADGAVTEAVEAAFADQGFRVARNVPFAGAYITQAYGRPMRGQHVVQVEIDRALYMDEQTIRPHPHFAEVQAALTRAMATIVSTLGQSARPLAAE